VGRVADLALSSEDVRINRRGLGDEVEHGRRVRAAEPDEEEPVIGRLAEAGPLEVQQRRHGLAARQPVAPVAVRVYGNCTPCVVGCALGYRPQAVEERGLDESVQVQGGEALNVGAERGLGDETAVVERFSQGRFRVRCGRPGVQFAEPPDCLLR